MGKINIYEFEHLLQNPIEQKVQENMLPINFRSHETYNPDEKMSEKKTMVYFINKVIKKNNNSNDKCVKEKHAPARL